MRIRTMLDTIRAVLLWLLVVPVAVIVVNAGLRLAAALTDLQLRAENPIVAFLSDSAQLLTPVPVRELLTDQTYWQTALLAVAAYALVAVLFVVLFRALRQLAVAMEGEAGPRA